MKFSKVHSNIFNKHAPYETKKLMTNQVPYISRNLRKIIIKKPLKTKYLEGVNFQWKGIS